VNNHRYVGFRELTVTYWLIGLIFLFLGCSDSDNTQRNTDVTGNGEKIQKQNTYQNSADLVEVHINEYVLNIPGWYIA
jgi:hypothetical protein